MFAERMTRLPWRRLGLIAGVYLLAVAIGVLPAWQRFDPTQLLVAALAAALGILALLAWFRAGRFEYGLLAVPLAAGLLNFVTLPTGTQSRIVLSLVVAGGLVGLWVLEGLVVRRRGQIRPSPINRPVFVFAAINAIALVWSQLLRDPLVYASGSFVVVQVAAMVVNVLLPLLSVLVVDKLRAVIWLKWLTWIVIGLGLVAITALAFNLPTARLIHNGSRGLFPMWVAAMAFSQALFNRGLPGLVRGGLLALLGGFLVFYFGLHTLWLSGWVPILVACAVITALHSKKLLVVLVLGTLVYLSLNFQTLYQNIIVANINEGGLQRLELWQRNLALVAQHPLFGTGPAGYAAYYMTYNASEARSTHNNYFDVAAQTGLVGLGAFLWLFAAFLRTGYRSARALGRQRNFKAAFASGTLAGCVGALVAMMLGDWVLPFAYNQTIAGFDNAVFTWLLLGGMVSLSQLARAPGASRIQTPEPTSPQVRLQPGG